MLIFLFNCFVKITGYIAQLFCFRTKKYYESEAAKKIPRGALIVSNHTSVYDYAVYLFVFFSKTLRVPMAEVLFEKKLLKLFLTMMGGIFVNRDSADLSFVYKCADILSKKGDVLIFPEGRIPREGEEKPLEFKPSVGMLALLSGAPIIPVYTNGSYFKRSRAKVVIGESFSPVIDEYLSDKEKAISAANQIREKIIKLGGMISDGKKTNKAKLFSPKYLLYDITKILACPGLVWHRPKVVYESDKAKEKIRGGAILVANHLGFFDPIYMMYAVYYRRHHFICIKDFFESKAGFLFKAFQCIPIDRNNFDTSTLRGIADHLGSGELVSMFPEGHVSTDGGNMDVFKSGVVLMAMMAGVPIIPLYIKPKKHWYERIKMALGERIYVEKNMSFQKMQSVTEEIMQKENKLKELLEEK